MTDGDIIIQSKPTPGQLIRDIHCWIATFEDGTEGIIAGQLGGVGMTPLMSSRRLVAESFEAVAKTCAKAAGNVREARLVTFTSTEGTRS